MAQFARFADILHAHGLTAGSVIGNGQHHTGDILAVTRLKCCFQFAEIHFALEGKFPLRIGSCINRAVQRNSLAEFDMPFRGIKVRVARNEVTLLQDR